MAKAAQKLDKLVQKEEFTEDEALYLLNQWVSWIERKQPDECRHFNRFAHELRVSAKGLRRKLLQHDSCIDLLELIDELSETEMIEKGLQGEYNATVWSKVMAKQHSWHDKQEVDVNADLSQLHDIISKRDQLVPNRDTTTESG